ncbi:MAG: phosphotransferase [Oligoflexia bacterium]|nr:phosphotransferase [Oligoflexia bacterium]
MHMHQELYQFATNTLAEKPTALKKLAGDASTREYFRVSMHADSYIICHDKIPAVAEYDFLILQNYFAQNGIPVPKIIAVDASQGFILQEDLGEQSLLRFFADQNDPDLEFSIYCQPIDNMIKIQSLELNKHNADTNLLRIYGRAFDREKYWFEIKHTENYFLKQFLPFAPSNSDLQTIDALFHTIVEHLVLQPPVLCHRDYHSKNIMRVPKMAIIDFQDARVGPIQYDLASLLDDCYYQLAPQNHQKLIDYYWENFAKSYYKKHFSSSALAPSQEKEHFIKTFDFSKIQRLYKAVGTFAYIYAIKKNPLYLVHIGKTMENIKATLQKYPELTLLKNSLFRYYYL